MYNSYCSYRRQLNMIWRETLGGTHVLAGDPERSHPTIIFVFVGIRRPL